MTRIGRVSRSAWGLAAVWFLALGLSPARAVEPVSFTQEIIPLLTNLGCNGGNCHGKTGGQIGFELSLFGFEPALDFDSIVKDSHGRRLFAAAPEQSLLLRKAVGAMPHAGGKRLDAGSPEYQLLIDWLNQGTPYGTPNEPAVVRLSMAPDKLLLKPASR